MSHPYMGPLAAYNSLTDKHLTGYFNNTRIRRHLQRAGLITRSGRIFTEKEYRINAMRRDHQKYIRECLAQAIFHKVLDMERHHQIEIKRKLETFAKKERVQRVKVDYPKRSDEETVPLFSPRPPIGPKSGLGHPLAAELERYDSSDSASPRPNTAPGNMQRPVRLQPIQGFSASGTAPKTSSGSRQKSSTYEQEKYFSSGVNKDIIKLINTMDHSAEVSPYRLPIINNFVMPVPPPPRKNSKNPRHAMNPRGRRFRPTTAPNDPEPSAKESGKFHKTSLHSNVTVTMAYLGKNVHLSHDDNDYRDEIKIFQQHCGGENLCIFKGSLLEGESFNFTSRRHRGFPFSLTFYINGIQMDRLSSCCEYKHRKGSRLGGKNGYFGFINVEGASPCYRCIISMGLDKKPSPPPRKAKEEDEDVKEEDYEDQKDETMIEDQVDACKKKFSEDAVTPEASSFVGADKDTSEDKSDMDYEEEGEDADEKNKEDKTDEYEADDEAKDEYDEDFEVDEEKPDEKLNEEGQVDDQVNGKSKSPSDDEKDDLDHEEKCNKPSKAAPEAADSETDERDDQSDSEYEADKQGKHSVADKNMIATAREIQVHYRKPTDHQANNQKNKTDQKQSTESLSSSSASSISSNGDESEVKNDAMNTEINKCEGLKKTSQQKAEEEPENHSVLFTERDTGEQCPVEEPSELNKTDIGNEQETSLEGDGSKGDDDVGKPLSPTVGDHNERQNKTVENLDDSKTGAEEDTSNKPSNTEEEGGEY